MSLELDTAMGDDQRPKEGDSRQRGTWEPLQRGLLSYVFCFDSTSLCFMLPTDVIHNDGHL